MAIIVPIEKPECCAECPFRTEYEYICADITRGLFLMMARCEFQPKDTEESGYKDIVWLSHNRHRWCPIETFEEPKISFEMEMDANIVKETQNG